MDFRDQCQRNLGAVSDFLESAAERAHESIGLSSGGLGLWFLAADLCLAVCVGIATASRSLDRAVSPATHLVGLWRRRIDGVLELGGVLVTENVTLLNQICGVAVNTRTG